MGNAVVHFELQGPDPEGTAKFYSQLFGWHEESMPGEQPYVVVDTHAGKGINGGFGKTQEGVPSNVTLYVETPDPEKALKKAESLGAKTVMPVTEVPGIVTFALFADPQGAVIGIVKSAEGQEDQGRPAAGSNPAVEWFEILSADPKKAWDFYSELFDWHVKDSSGEGFVYGEVETNAGKGINGGIGSSPDGQPHVNVYAEVDDIQKQLDKAESLGGKTIVPPMEAGNVKFAQFADPQGTTFGLFTGM